MISKDAGYTIIEALCAFAILAVGLSALYASASTSLRGIGRITKVQDALLLAHSKLDEISADRGLLPTKMSGKFAGSDISWNAAATAIPTPRSRMAHLVLQNVRLTLSWPTGFGHHRLTFDTRHLGEEQQ
jgi:type II secretory pathway pseudopilin PulG